MSRGFEARRKARRRQAQATATLDPDRRSEPPARSRSLLIPIGLIALAPVVATLAILDTGGSHGLDRKQINRNVNALLAGIPQRGTTLGSPGAPVTLRVFADLECLDVKRFAMSGLRSIISTWVRKGVIKLEYHPLETDTRDQAVFARQEMATLAAGRQGRMWDFALTFIYQQQEQFTDYATEEFLEGIASQVPGLDWARWQHDRKVPGLFTQVARSHQSARAQGFRTTPTFLIGPTGGDIDQVVGSKTAPGIFLDARYLAGYVESFN